MSGPKLEKRMILGSSKLTKNLISTSWYFCSTDWWTSEFRHFCIWNYQKLNKRSYYTFKNNYDSPKPIRYGPYHTEIRLNVYWKHTLETLPFGNIILFWKQIFIILERYTEYWKNVDWKQNLYNWKYMVFWLEVKWDAWWYNGHCLFTAS